VQQKKIFSLYRETKISKIIKEDTQEADMFSLFCLLTPPWLMIKKLVWYAHFYLLINTDMIVMTI